MDLDVLKPEKSCQRRYVRIRLLFRCHTGPTSRDPTRSGRLCTVFVKFFNMELF